MVSWLVSYMNGACVLLKTEEEGDLSASQLHVTDSKLVQHRNNYDIGRL